MKYCNFKRAQALVDIIGTLKKDYKALESRDFNISVEDNNGATIMKLGCFFPKIQDELRTGLLAEISERIKEAESELETL